MSEPTSSPIYHPQYQPPSQSSSVARPSSKTPPSPLPASGEELNYHNLLHRLRERTILFRVWDSTSHSPLVWTGSSALSGFFAANKNLHLSPKSYEKSFGHLRRDFGWSSGPWLKSSMVDHILCDTMGAHLKSGAAKDEMSPWISGTLRLDWGIWDIARRLAHGQEKVYMTIIKQPLEETADPAGVVTRPPKGLELKFWAPATTLLKTQGANTVVPKPTDEAIAAALKARQSFETLFYGRVFADSIEANVVWTKSQIPFELPGKFWHPQASRRPGDWLTKLRWDPRRDDFETAQTMMNERWKTLWWQQPVHKISSEWPPKDDRNSSSKQVDRLVPPKPLPQTSASSATRPFTQQPRVDTTASRRMIVAYTEPGGKRGHPMSAESSKTRLVPSRVPVTEFIPKIPVKKPAVDNAKPPTAVIPIAVKPPVTSTSGTNPGTSNEVIAARKGRKKKTKRAVDLMGAEEYESEAIAKLEASLINLSTT